MAHTILVKLDVDDEYKEIHPEITADDYLGSSKALGWEVVSERVFTESEVRAYIAALKDETMFRSVDSMVDRLARKVLSLDPS